MRVYVQGFNLFTLTRLEGYDPELDESITYYYPQMRTFTFGVSGALGGGR